VGKTYRDLKEFDKARNKENSRKAFKDVDMRTRVKPLQKKERGGGKNSTKDIVDSYIAELEEDWAENMGDFENDTF